MTKKYYSRYGLFEDPRTREADKEISAAIRRFRADMARINRKYGDLGLTDTDVSESITQEVYTKIHSLPDK